MAKVTLGRTGLQVEMNGFGALPVQRVPMDGAVALLRRALDGGMEFFDTARAYTDSEEKLGKAFEGRRDELVLATKTMKTTVEGFWEDLETSLSLLKTDHIDIYQFHNPERCPKPDDGTGLYEAMLEARRQGKIRFIGLTNHRLDVAREAVTSGLYDTLQFPFSYLCTKQDVELVSLCREHNVGFIAMKGLSGGLITNSAAACANAAQYGNVVPIWGIQRQSELDEFLSYIPNAPALDERLQQVIDHDRAELQGDFCRGCGYCMPCPKGIEINTCARAGLMIRRSPGTMFFTERGKAMMQKIEDCIHCNQCMKKCPYGLNTPDLLKRNYEDYKELLAARQA